MRQIFVKLTCIAAIAFAVLLLVPSITYGQSANSGWVSLTSDPPGAAVYVDNQSMTGQDGRQLVTPCTVYIDPGQHVIKLSLKGYADGAGTIDMQANTQHAPMFMSLNKPVVQPMITLIVPLVILLFIILIPIGVILGVVILGYILVKRKK